MQLMVDILALCSLLLSVACVGITVAGIWSIRRTRRREALRDIPPSREILSEAGVSVIVRGYCDLETVERWLSLDYPRYEVVLLTDFEGDPLSDSLLDRYAMFRTEFVPLGELPCDRVRTVYRSRERRYRKLIVVDMAFAAPASDFNCGVCLGGYEWTIVFDRWCQPAPDLLRRLLAEYYQYDRYPVFAVGAFRVGELPRQAIRMVDIVAEMVFRGAGSGVVAGWRDFPDTVSHARNGAALHPEVNASGCRLGGGMRFSEIPPAIGCFGGTSILFDRESVIAAGGYQDDRSPDMELYYRIRSARRRYAIPSVSLFTPRIIVTDRNPEPLSRSLLPGACTSGNGHIPWRTIFTLMLVLVSFIGVVAVLTGEWKAAGTAVMILVAGYVSIATSATLSLVVIENLWPGYEVRHRMLRLFAAALLFPFSLVGNLLRRKNFVDS